MGFLLLLVERFHALSSVFIPLVYFLEVVFLMLFNEVMIELRGKLEVFLRYFLLEILLTSHFLVLLLDLLESGQLDPFRLLFTELK